MSVEHPLAIRFGVSKMVNEDRISITTHFDHAKNQKSVTTVESTF